MNRILFSWGLGGGFAHLSRLEPMARNLRAAGYEVLFVSKDTQCAAKWLGPYGYRFLRAPVSARVYKLTMPLANYTEVLIAEGYTELAAWRGNVEGGGIYQLYRPDVWWSITRLRHCLQRAILDSCCVQVGNGFELPSLILPFPSTRPWESIARVLLEHSETKALAAIYAVAKIYQSKPLGRMTDLFDLNGFTLESFSALDHYGFRQGMNYAGPIFPSHHGLKGNLAQWLSGSVARGFACLPICVHLFRAVTY